MSHDFAAGTVELVVPETVFFLRDHVSFLIVVSNSIATALIGIWIQGIRIKPGAFLV